MNPVFTMTRCRIAFVSMNAFFILSMVACSPVTFDNLPLEAQNGSYSNFFKLSVSEVNIEQPKLDTNRTSIAFQVLDLNGNHVSSLKSTDFSITENGTAVPAFKLDSNSKKIVQPVDIVFAVDITGSMSPTIESAKSRLVSFVQKSRASGTHSRMCLITFGDSTVKKCDRFYDNNPADPSTEAQVKELISEISKLRAYSGVDDPGGSDLNENPMRALIDASNAPWNADAQRFVILITDDGFLYTPGNQGAVGIAAPRFSEVTQAIQTSQMKVFAATPSLAGYDKPFSGLPGIVAASGGEWFNFNDLISGKITLDTILNRIVNRIQTTYVVEYTVDDKDSLDPTLPLSQRQIEIRLINGETYAVTVQAIQSNLPNGREPYKKRWRLSDKKIKKETLSVRVDGKRIESGFTLSDNGDLEFETPPSAGSKIQVRYRCNLIRDDIQLAPIMLPADTNLDSVVAIINGVETKDIELIKTLDGTYSLRLSDRILSEEDPFGIRDAEGLSIQVQLMRLNERR